MASTCPRSESWRGPGLRLRPVRSNIPSLDGTFGQHTPLVRTFRHSTEPSARPTRPVPNIPSLDGTFSQADLPVPNIPSLDGFFDRQADTRPGQYVREPQRRSDDPAHPAVGVLG